MPAQDLFASVGETNVSPVPVCFGTTTSATPIDLAQVPLEPNSSLQARVLVVARRTDNGASKAWDASALISRIGSTVTIDEASGGAGADAFCSAANTTAMAGCSISLATNGTNAGVRCTGPAGVTVEWAVTLIGLALTA